MGCSGSSTKGKTPGKDVKGGKNNTNKGKGSAPPLQVAKPKEVKYTPPANIAKYPGIEAPVFENADLKKNYLSDKGAGRATLNNKKDEKKKEKESENSGSEESSSDDDASNDSDESSSNEVNRKADNY
mmetsp:Transcript_19423/g.17214  ORF Transcript_19423/g.17214 Transcript_19423/m.17214 type:complete len:128 (-) Transcript_19423:38-421(-)